MRAKVPSPRPIARRQKLSAGARLRAALRAERPLQVAGVINAYAAILAESAGFKALYLSGAGVANASYGLPDIGITTLENVLVDVARITARAKAPLLVGIDIVGRGTRTNAEAVE